MLEKPKFKQKYIKNYYKDKIYLKDKNYLKNKKILKSKKNLKNKRKFKTPKLVKKKYTFPKKNLHKLNKQKKSTPIPKPNRIYLKPKKEIDTLAILAENTIINKNTFNL